MIEDKRTILNILVNFFKNQKMVEKEFNATMRMNREAPRLPFWNFKEGEGHLDFFKNFMVKASNFGSQNSSMSLQHRSHFTYS